MNRTLINFNFVDNMVMARGLVLKPETIVGIHVNTLSTRELTFKVVRLSIEAASD